MPSLRLTAMFVKNVKPTEKQIDYNDTGTYGLSLRVSKTGVKTWSVRYTPVGAEDQVRLSVGHYSEEADNHMSLDAARLKAMQLQTVIHDGGKVVSARQQAKADAAALAKAITVAAAVKVYLAQKLPTLKNEKARYNYAHGFDAMVEALGPTTPLMSVTRSDIREWLLKKALTSPTSANRLRNKVQGLFQWAADEQGVLLDPAGPLVVLLTSDPSAGIKKPHKETKRQAEDMRTLNDDEQRVLLRAIQRTNRMSQEIKLILQIIALTSRRPNEVCGIEIDHLERWNQPENSIINLPPSVMKAGLRYLLPVNPLLRQVIEAAKWEWNRNRQMGRDSKYLFPTQFRHKRGDLPMSANSVAQAMSRLIDSLVAERPEDERIVAKLKADRPTPYAFRRSVTNGLSMLEVSREDRKAVMAHAEDDVLAGHYEPYDRLKEKRAALLVWENHLASVLIGERAASLDDLIEAGLPDPRPGSDPVQYLTFNPAD